MLLAAQQKVKVELVRSEWAVPALPLLAQQPTHKLTAPRHQYSAFASFKKSPKKSFLVGLFALGPLSSAVLPALKLVSSVV